MKFTANIINTNVLDVDDTTAIIATQNPYNDID